ncbi:MAG: hypothetical protein ABIA75_00590 [Candidatus Neomarinimicrobiota bacterium]
MNLRRFRAYLRLLRMHYHSRHPRLLNTSDRHRLQHLEDFLRWRYSWWIPSQTISFQPDDYSQFLRLILINDFLCRQIFFEYISYSALVPLRNELSAPRHLRFVQLTPVQAFVVLRL